MDSQSKNAINTYAQIQPTTVPDFVDINVLDYYFRGFSVKFTALPRPKNDTPAHFGSPGGAKFGKLFIV